MVHALEEIHRLLRPNGILIDIHPFPQAPEVKVIQGDEVIFAEPKRDIQDEDEDVKQADRALAEVVERGCLMSSIARNSISSPTPHPYLSCETSGKNTTRMTTRLKRRPGSHKKKTCIPEPSRSDESWGMRKPPFMKKQKSLA